MTEETERIATCSCGQLQITASGDPDVVVACSCIACQRRTGSPYGVGAYFKRDSVQPVEGKFKSHQRGTDSGRTFTTNFCPQCGTSVYWELEMRPDHIGVAVGCFGDPSFPGPARAVWAESRHDWVTYPDDLPVFEKAAT
jgi:hypothetical protein